MAHLKTRETHRDEEGRKRWKIHLVRRLYEHGYSRGDIVNLFHFIDWIMRLPEEMEESFWTEIHEYEEAKKVEYITSVERIGIKKGIQQGIQQGMLQDAREMVLDALETKFGGSSARLKAQVAQITDRDKLKEIHKMLLKIQDIEELEKATVWN